MDKDKLRIIPFGGLGEIGRNMLVMEYNQDILIIDCGLMFPENDMLGIDVIIPDLSYVFERADRVKGVIVTHGHEDHVGALPYLLDVIKAPVYATSLTCGLLEVKLREAGVQDVDLHTIQSGDTVSIGPFQIEFFHVSHSIPDGVGLGIHTPIGLIVHSGDFKFDYSPVDGQLTDFAKLAELGGQGVLLLLSDSTNSEKVGYTPSEQLLGKTISRLFDDAKGRIIVATFASNISRVQQVIDIAQAHDRRVAVVGRSMVNNVRIARKLGYLTVPDDVLLPVNQLADLPDHQVTFICTGSQGEPTSALVRMGQRRFHSIRVMPGDTIIISATPIPGNEEFVNRTIDNLFRLEADVFYDKVMDVHVSGHASQEEQKMLINLLRPNYFVPVHGEYRHLVIHSKTAKQCGLAPENIFVMQTADVLEMGPDGGEIVDHLSDDYIAVDGHGVGAVGRTILKDRQILAKNGFLIAVVTLDKYSSTLVGEPQIVTRGFGRIYRFDDLLAQAKEEIAKAVERGGTRAELIKRLQASLASFAVKETGRQPIVLAMVNKV